MSSEDALAARKAALRLLSAVIVQRRMLSDCEAEITERLAPSDRARAGRLARIVLRHLSRADRVLDPHLDRSPPLQVRNALRLAVVEMAVLGAAPHGAVSSAVGLLKRSSKGAKFTGLANAVLRKVSAGMTEAFNSGTPQPLPPWIARPVEKAWGLSVLRAVETAHEAGAAIDLTGGPAITDEIRAGLTVEELPTGSLRLKASAQVSALPGYAEGAFWVQDAAAAVPAKVLAAKPGETVLDLCAAPGGKTMQLAAHGANVIAVDSSGPRMDRVRENLSRVNLGADCVVADILKWEPDGPVDGILLDAPCTATGTIRRHPDLPHVRDGSGAKALFDLQAKMLDRALGWLKPGGRLVYSTCSLLTAEGERQIKGALERHADLRVDRAALAVPGIEDNWISDIGLRLRPDYWPQIGGMDGFFVSCLVRH